ncbi:right-handed parallel beta-helix repeat-containing protein [Nocardioides flavus (ex Wang et al. 2016)]|uniref:right-handed parallel beta-helix repeat-containing protein n=1 Tax=Nocardioides flavus (ex Wang et al. 2016) TaxID=2058780 RepID=UPI00174DC1B5|nr:right-handed parallel beta-helix repeat-containing protein [Nocardioides flavus (ex Wang et al. 2016)]
MTTEVDSRGSATTTPRSRTDTASPARPDSSNTGVPEGLELTASEGLDITEDGTVVDGLHVRGTVTISADYVVLRNTLIQTDTSLYPVKVEDASNVVIEDVEIDAMGGTGIGIFFSRASGTVRRVNIHSAEDGIRIEGDDVVVESSYIHDLHRQPGGHHDAIQIRRGDDVVIRGNTLLPFVEATNDPMNAAIQIGSLLGDDRISDLEVVDNYMDGGNYTVNGGGRDEVESAVYRGNRFGRNYRYAVSGNLDNSAWDSTNVWDDTGAPAR